MAACLLALPAAASEAALAHLLSSSHLQSTCLPVSTHYNLHTCLSTCRYVSFVVATAVIWVLVAVVWGLGSHFKARARQR